MLQMPSENWLSSPEKQRLLGTHGARQRPRTVRQKGEPRRILRRFQAACQGGGCGIGHQGGGGTEGPETQTAELAG